MFKNAIIYRITTLPDLNVIPGDGLLQNHAFAPCSPNQEKSSGWVPPRDEDFAPLIELVGGQLILKLMTETKQVPSSIVDRHAKEAIKVIEQNTGRKPGKKETAQLKEDIKQTLLPNAFGKLSSSLVWIDPVAKLLVIDATSQAKADDVVSVLVTSIEGLQLGALNTVTSPAAAMSLWLTSDEAPAGFSVDRECELKAQDESKAVVKYGHHPLDIDEVKAHIAAGKAPTKLALTWDDRVSIVLTEGLAIKKIQFLDVVFEKTLQGSDSGFDANAAIMTGEFAKLIPDLIEALGGEPAAF